MNDRDFVAPETGKLIPTPYGIKAFVPTPLPPKLNMAELTMPLAEAMQAIGELRGASRRLANPYILVRPLQRQEALTSSAMEGTFTTDDDLVLAEAGLEERLDSGSREVRNYLLALKGALHSLQNEGLPISHRMLKNAHRTLLAGVGSGRGANRKPGEYKTEQNAIGGTRIETARFVPPPPNEAQICMDELEKYINREEVENAAIGSALIEIALAHYQLETIHPFADGNGRVGRMLISLMAVQRKLFDMPLLYVSPAMEGHKDEYIDLMYNVSAKGEWEEWIKFFLKMVCKSAHETIGTIDRLIYLQEDFKRKAAEAMRTSNIVLLVDHLFEAPVVTIPQVNQFLNVTYRSGKSVVDKLCELKILSEIDGTYPKIYVAWDVMRVANHSK